MGGGGSPRDSQPRGRFAAALTDPDGLTGTISQGSEVRAPGDGLRRSVGLRRPSRGFGTARSARPTFASARLPQAGADPTDDAQGRWGERSSAVRKTPWPIGGYRFRMTVAAAITLRAIVPGHRQSLTAPRPEPSAKPGADGAGRACVVVLETGQSAWAFGTAWMSPRFRSSVAGLGERASGTWQRRSGVRALSGSRADPSTPEWPGRRRG